LDQCLDKETVNSLEVRQVGNGDHEMVAKLKDGSVWEFYGEFPTRWLFEDFEEELTQGIKDWQKQLAEEIKQKAAKRAAKKAAKEKLKAAAAAKLTPEERKALGLKL
jgi:hypothetical protein